ncbi:MAG: XRE family transcriptional regulator [Peptococcaceae bacterium]|nr:MAG: XRE family transcriptional regulator [Peptococcaceae bacterium]
MLVVRKERLKKGWTMKKLSEKAGIPYTTLSALETGKAYPWPKHKKALAKALQVKTDRLFEEVGGE